MSKYEVPASIKIEVQKALITWWKNNNEEIMLPRDILYVVNVVSESFAAALAENPITPTDKQAEELWRHLNGIPHRFPPWQCALSWTSVRAEPTNRCSGFHN